MYKKTELIYKEDARRIIDSPRSKQQMLNMLDSIPPIADVLDKIRDEIVEEQSTWREDADAEWHECRRILRIIDKYKGDKE